MEIFMSAKNLVGRVRGGDFDRNIPIPTEIPGFPSSNLSLTDPVAALTATEELQNNISPNTPNTLPPGGINGQSRDARHKDFIQSNPFAARLKSFSNNALVAFKVSPDITETRSASYKSLDPIHLPGSIQVYTNTSPRTWSLGGLKLISRNAIEAEENLQTVNQLRSWMVPFFGATNTQGVDGYSSDLLGSPPEVLKFSAYSDVNGNSYTNIRNIPVVMTNLSIPYPTDVDYIKTSESNQPFPAIMNVEITIVETHSPREFSNFDLIKYRKGQLQGF
jgi:hypothetical protein